MLTVPPRFCCLAHIDTYTDTRLTQVKPTPLHYMEPFLIGEQTQTPSEFKSETDDEVDVIYSFSEDSSDTVSNHSPSAPKSLNNRRKTRPRNFQNWMDTKRKTLVNQGKAHLSRQGRVVEAREMGPPCNCMSQCAKKILEVERKEIFNKFWALGQKEKQWLFAVDHTQKHNKNRKKCGEVKVNRQFTYKYFLPKNISENLTITKIKVCKIMFLNTLGINGMVVVTAWQKYEKSGALLKDLRGHYEKKKKVISDEMVQSVCAHIRLCEASPKKSKLNYTQMFQLYKKWPDLEQYSEKASTARQYRDIAKSHIKQFK
ncbi:hypothetical protein ABMA27_001314 [Loxostege sticticalis]|uniref:Uncharacterized protein n=1 Tax=Loxostege sticticalis TaxID=481309 RepID=A0ABR3HY12_LOXSC